MSELTTKRWFRILLGVLAVLGMVALGYYQRRTGPTWPIPVDTELAGSHVAGRLLRTQAGDGDARIHLAAPEAVTGEVRWRRYPTGESWTRVKMVREGDSLAAYLPAQPAAAKLEYSVRLAADGEEIVLPANETAVIRFRGDVPAWVLIPHILAMFIAMALVLRAAFGALLGEDRLGRFIPWILGFLVPGGLILGPLVQKYAFDAYWTGWPFGGDWTDNKTLAAVLAWVAAWLVVRYRPAGTRIAVLLAAVIMLGVYLIPHSVRGSELDWEKMEVETGQLPPASVPDDRPVPELGAPRGAPTPA